MARWLGSGWRPSGALLFIPLFFPIPALKQPAFMTALSAFGLFAVTAMVICYACEKRSPWFVFGFACSCVLGSIYGFLQGAWPFGLVEAVWAVIAARRWWTER